MEPEQGTLKREKFVGLDNNPLKCIILAANYYTC